MYKDREGTETARRRVWVPSGLLAAAHTLPPACSLLQSACSRHVKQQHACHVYACCPLQTHCESCDEKVKEQPPRDNTHTQHTALKFCLESRGAARLHGCCMKALYGEAPECGRLMKPREGLVSAERGAR